MAIINFPILYIPDPDKNNTLFNGQIYVGEPGQDAANIPTNQKQLRVVDDNNVLIDVAQPFLLSAGGVPVYQPTGQPVRLDVDGDFSLLILDKNGQQKYYIRNVYSGEPILAEDLPQYVAAEFSTLEDMVFGNSQNLGTVDFADYVGRDVATAANNSVSMQGGARYRVKTLSQAAADGDVIDGTGAPSYFGGNHPANDGVHCFILQDAASFYNYGARGVAGNDDTEPLQLCIDNNDVVIFSVGVFEASDLMGHDNLTITGVNREKCILKTTGQDWALRIYNYCKLQGFSIYPLTTDSTFTHPDDDFDDPNKDFDYYTADDIAGIVCTDSQSIQIVDVKVAQLWRGHSFGRCNDVTITRCSLYQIGIWQAQYFDCTDVKFVKNTSVYGGGSGGVAFSSTKQAVITNNFVIGSGTGINPGGSGAAGFNCEDFTVSNNIVIARDCINLENGIERAVVSSNIVQVFENQDLPGVTGVGISCSSDSSGTAAGLVSDITIIGNRVNKYSRNVANGIRVSSNAGDYSDKFENVQIIGNHVDGANNAYNVSSAGSTIQDVILRGNIGKTCVKGAFLSNIEGLDCDGNTFQPAGDIVLGGYKGYQLLNVTRGSLAKSKLYGFGESVELDAGCETIRLHGIEYLKHKVSGANPSARLVSSTDSYWNGDNNGVVITDTGNRLIVNSQFVRYEPASATTIQGLIGGFPVGGEIVHILFNGNVTLQNSSALALRGGVNTAPPADASITFGVTSELMLREISRTY